MSCVGIVYKGGRNFDLLLTKDRRPHIPSMGFNLLTLVTTVILTVGTNAAIGPVADLHIVNKQISPDGFTRESAYELIIIAAYTHSVLLVLFSRKVFSRDHL